ncbi:uncharacterized protein JN550_013174 [Neoarthrinium moseri]|uniref:uncharacterized protein n=1 Tax=Neoarthrinium moseri TaxID=1658444 RepID=UPI001FDD1865|nr:uncharacterized protein JN550_013174 [Neoarthrinium moseri]KAI1857541.1 hypothetical protein JN550_013174 [Neoarthrinium moseri]
MAMQPLPGSGMTPDGWADGSGHGSSAATPNDYDPQLTDDEQTVLQLNPGLNPRTFAVADRRHRFGMSLVERLPQCVLRCVTDQLPSASITLLSLVNSRMRSRLMWGDVQLQDDEDQHSQFLDILSRDIDPMAHCLPCQKLHPPLRSLMREGPMIQGRDTKGYECLYSCTGDNMFSDDIPRRLTPVLIKGIMKLHRQRKDYRHLMEQVNTTRASSINGFMISINIECKVRNDRLVLKTEQVWACQDVTSAAVWRLEHALQESWYAPIDIARPIQFEPLCKHKKWSTELHDGCTLPDLYPHRACARRCKSGITHTPGCLESTKIGPGELCLQLDCIFRHDRNCDNGCLTSLGKYSGCEVCSTDFLIDKVEIPKPFGWGLRLTTWKDLGNGSATTDWTWIEQLPGIVKLNVAPRVATDPQACTRTRFESFSPDHSVLPIGGALSTRIDDLCEFLRRGYASICIGHVADYPFGIIQNPDPIDHPFPGD